MLCNKMHALERLFPLKEKLVFRIFLVHYLFLKNNALEVLLTYMATNVTLCCHFIIAAVHNRKK